MLKKITGSNYIEMLRHGVSHLAKHASAVNDLNVFPVPDGDTGTNMVMTMRNGLHSIHEGAQTIAHAAHDFASATVFGARGNSGVIVSQFFKGISEGLTNLRDADCAAFVDALDKGCDYAYAAVAKPVEGTILTVLRDATDAVKARLDRLHTIDDVIATFLAEAKTSLENTPKLLPILEKAGVVDSGGSGIVYFFEGVQKYLNGEPLDGSDTEEASAATDVDYTAFHKDSDFSFGYCTEALLQLTVDVCDFDYLAFTDGLGALGESVVTTLEGDKVKLHVHSGFPETVLQFCHPFGEFLSLKIENMSVQHSGTAQKLLLAKNGEEGAFAVVAVAPNSLLQGMLSEMGADAVILSEEAPSSQDFLEAFDSVSREAVLVFPNSSNSILSAMQAGSLYQKAKITVLNCRSIPQCYAALAMLDFNSEDMDAVVDGVHQTIGNLFEVSVVRAEKDVQFGDCAVAKNDYFALAGDEILLTDATLEGAAANVADEILSRRDCSVVTLFYGKAVTEERALAIAHDIENRHGDVEACLLPTQNAVYDLVLSFE